MHDSAASDPPELVNPAGPESEAAANPPFPQRAEFKRNDSISPIVVIALVLFWLLQSSFANLALRALHRGHAARTAASRTSVSGEMPSDLASGIPTISMEAKQSYLGGTVAVSAHNSRRRGLLTFISAAKSPLGQRRDALAEATKLLTRYPDQAVIARDVILLRAETGISDPLGLTKPAPVKAASSSTSSKNPVAKPGIKTAAPTVNPLAAYDPVKGEPAGRARLRASERQVMVELFSSMSVPLARSDEAQIDREIAGLPQMRWWGHLAEHQAALRAGDAAGASLALVEARRQAVKSATGVSLLGLFELAALLIGLAGLIRLAARWSADNRVESAEDRSIFAVRAPLIADSERRLGAGDLANLFFLYLALMVGLEFALNLIPASAIHRALLHLRYDQQLTAAILLDFALTALCGVLTLMAMIWLARRRGASLAREIGLNLGGRSLLRTALFGFLGWSISLPLSYLVDIVGRAVFHGAPDPANPIIPIIMAAPNGLPMLLLYVLAAFLAPFFEETMFRGLFFNAARLRLGTTAAILLTGIAFGLSHEVGIAQQCALATLGAVFAWMAYTKKSLLPGMFAHFYQNTVVFGNLAFSLMIVTRAHGV